MSTARIRPLDPKTDMQAVTEFYAEAPDYWLMAEGAAPDDDKVSGFFTDGPPGCDPALSHRLGLFLGQRLSGLAELSFGFPNAADAYLGLMILGPWAQGQGHGQSFLNHVERLARARGASELFLAVFEANTRGRAFWEREGFRATGKTGQNDRHILHRLVKPL